MSAHAIAADVLTELHADVRVFGTSKGALLWYRNELLRRLRCRGAGSGDDATFAAIVSCLQEHHPADEIGRGLSYIPHGRWKNQPAWTTGEALLWLVAWYENTSDDGTDMAVVAGLDLPLRHRDPDASALALQAGLQRRAFQRRCEATARKLRLRLVYARVVEI